MMFNKDDAEMFVLMLQAGFFQMGHCITETVR